MSLRSVLNVAIAIILVGVTAWLSYYELTPDERTGQNRIAPTEARARHRVAREDPLIDLRYEKSRRRRNFVAFGMPEDMARQAEERARRIEEQHAERLDVLLRDAAEPELLTEVLCGDLPRVPTRYAATSFLVEQDQGVRRPLKLRRTARIERQDWSLTSPIETLYEALELVDDRPQDATLMGIAAILLGREEDAIERHKPWGRGLVVGGWSRKALEAEAPQVRELLVDYFALLHVVVEAARGEGGLCGT